MSMGSPESHSPDRYGLEVPDDIWMEILARIPADLVVQLRCLSKFHRNMISSPGFIKKHSDQSHKTKTTSTPTYFITPSLNPKNKLCRSDKLGFMKDYFVKKFDPNNNFDPTVVHRLNPPYGNKSYKCVGSSKGILLLRSPENIMLWNPLTGESRTFPKVKGAYKSVNYFLGHDQTNGDLKIVKMMHNRNPEVRGKCDCEIYSSKSGSWRGKVIEADHSLQFANHVGVFVDGTDSLHMIGKDREEGVVFIAAFDFSAEKFSRIPVPKEISLRFKYNIWNLDGFLCAYTNKAVLSVWMMKEYGNEESWVQVLRFDSLYHEREMGIKHSWNVKPLQVMNDGRQWILLSDQGVLFLDMEGIVSLEKTDRSRFQFQPLGFEYTPTLRPV